MDKIFRFCLLIVMILALFTPVTGVGGERPQNGSQKDSGRNPFSDTDLIQKEAEKRIMGGITPPSRLPEGIPNLMLRGYIEGNGKKSAALLEIQGTDVYIVHEGDSLNLHSGLQNILLKVREIRNMNLILGVGVRGQEIIVR